MASIESKLLDPEKCTPGKFFNELIDAKSELCNDSRLSSIIKKIPVKILNMFAELLTGHGNNTANRKNVKEAFFRYCKDASQELIAPCTIVRVLKEYKRFIDEQKIVFMHVVFKIADTLKIEQSPMFRSYCKIWTYEPLTVNLIREHFDELPRPFVLNLT